MCYGNHPSPQLRNQLCRWMQCSLGEIKTGQGSETHCGLGLRVRSGRCWQTRTVSILDTLAGAWGAGWGGRLAEDRAWVRGEDSWPGVGRSMRLSEWASLLLACSLPLPKAQAGESG